MGRRADESQKAVKHLSASSYRRIGALVEDLGENRSELSSVGCLSFGVRPYAAR